LSVAAYSYRAYLEDGSPEAGVIEAVDRRDASRKLAQAKKRPFMLVEATGTKTADAAGSRRFWEFTRQGDLTKLLSELSVLLDAGFNVAAALRVIASAESSARQRTRLFAISDQISNGKSLSEAFASLPGLPTEMSAMIASGESSGRIAQVIARMAEAYQYRAERRVAILEALIYPAFLVMMVIGAFLFLSLFLMPAIEPIFDSGTVEKPMVVWLLSGFGALLSQHWSASIALILATIASVVLMLRNSSFRSLVSKTTLALPVIGRMRRDSAISRYLDTLSLLTGNGVAMIESLRLAALTCSGPEIGEGLKTVRSSVSNGERLKSALERTGVFDGQTLTLVGIGEESNNLPLLLKRASRLVETRLKKSIDLTVTFLTPAITIALGLLIGALVVSVMTALLSINEIAVQ
jgi:general secretion pathway protein F